MPRSFETSDQHASTHLRPIRVPVLKNDIYRAAKEMVDDLEAWEIVSESPADGLLVCRKPGGFLGGTATITIRIEGPEDVPSTTVNARSESDGGLLPRDKSNVLEFMKLFNRRIC